MFTIARQNFTDADGVLHKNDIYPVTYMGSDGKPHISLAAVADLDAYEQILAAVVLTVRGELQLDTERGIPYFDTVFASNRLIDQWALAVRRAVLEKPFVESIDDFTYNFNHATNTLEYELDVTTDLGSLTVSA